MNLDLILDTLESDLQLHVAEQARRRLFVHAGVVGWKGRAIVIPGRSFTGKTTLVAELVRAGASYYSDEYALIDSRGKIHLTLEKELKKLDRFEALIVDDIGYVQQSREEMEVLFTLLPHRYERRSILLTSNLIFSDWERIFKDPLTTAAAIDRLVHHSVILELNVPSYRMESAKKKQQENKK